MSKHIPGPWRVVAQPHDGFTVEGSEPVCVVEGVYDAHIIAAAPDLLAAAKFLLEFGTNSSHKDIPEVIAARKAIAKAEGRE